MYRLPHITFVPPTLRSRLFNSIPPVRNQHYNQILFHSSMPLCCYLNTLLRYIFQLFSITCLLVWSGGGGALFVIEARPGPVCLQGRPELPRARYACVRGGDGVSRRSRGQEIDGNHGNNTRVLATLYNLQHCHSAQPVRHTQTVVGVVYATRIVANAEVFRFISCTIS